MGWNSSRRARRVVGRETERERGTGGEIGEVWEDRKGDNERTGCGPKNRRYRGMEGREGWEME